MFTEIARRLTLGLRLHRWLKAHAEASVARFLENRPNYSGYTPPDRGVNWVGRSGRRRQCGPLNENSLLHRVIERGHHQNLLPYQGRW